jgi:hypothetical protein
MSLTDTQLRDLSKAMEFPLADVCFKNEMPKKLEFNKGYMINIEDAEDEEGNRNGGSHWTALQINNYPNGKIEGIYFDPYGVGMPQDVEKAVKDTIGKKIPHTTKDIQSLMNNACGYYCSAFLHFINASQYRTKNLYEDVNNFLDMFDDLNKSVDFKKNEYILKHFFRAKDAESRMPVDIDNIVEADTGNNVDLTRIPVGVNVMKKG